MLGGSCVEPLPPTVTFVEAFDCNLASHSLYYVCSMKSLSLIAVVCSLFFASSSAQAEGNSIRGLVVDGSGRPINGAEVRAERTDGKGRSQKATTNAKGQYMLNHLDTANYKLVAFIKKTPKSVANIQTSANGWVKVDFAITDIYKSRVSRDQSAMDRIQGQDMRRMTQDQAFGR